MPPPNQRDSGPEVTRSLEEVVSKGVYPIEAYNFVSAGLQETVAKVHSKPADPDASRHINGQQLCHGLREFALAQWGLMARTVLNRWNVRRTEDFGKIVFNLIACKAMSKTDEDTLDDFSRVYDFAAAFDGEYLIDPVAIRSGMASVS